MAGTGQHPRFSFISDKFPIISIKKSSLPLGATANSRNGLEAWLTGMKATDGVTMMFGVHGAEEIGGGFVLGLFLSAAPMHKQAIAEAPKHPHDAHGLWFANPALVVPMRYVEALVQPAFDAPGSAVILQPLSGVQGLGPKAGHQRDGFGRVVAQMPAQESDLLHAREADLLRGGCARA